MLADHTEQAAKELGVEYTMEKVTDINEIISFGIVATPALVVDGQVKVSGRVLSADAIKPLIG
jgi:small redox-active disulfide protein 2